MKINRYDESEGAKLVFVALWAVFTIIFAIVMHFVVMIKGWGLSVQSWGWLIFLGICCVVLGVIKGKVINFIKEEL